MYSNRVIWNNCRDLELFNLLIRLYTTLSSIVNEEKQNAYSKFNSKLKLHIFYKTNI